MFGKGGKLAQYSAVNAPANHDSSLARPNNWRLKIMPVEDIEFLGQLWGRLVGEAFAPASLACQVKADGGHDMSNLSQEELIQLMEGSFSGQWKEPGFSFSELLSFYCVPDGVKSPKQIVAWVFASFVIADAIQHGAADWELELDKLIDGFLAIRKSLETQESVHFFKRVFSCSG